MLYATFKTQEELGLDYPLEGIDPPGQALIDHANAMLHTADYQRFRQKIISES